jgi:hypothetical protein
MPDNISFYFSLDLPKDALSMGVYIFQMVTLTPTADDYADKMSIGCVTQVGNAGATKTYQWEGDAEMDYYTNGAVKFDDINSDQKIDNAEITKNENESFYALEESPLSFKNMIQNCEALLPIEKQSSSSEIFTSYNALLQARIYASKDDAEPVNLSESEFEITLEAPVYEAEEWDENDETWYEDIENEFFIQHEEYAEYTKPDSTGTDRDF